MTEKRKGEIYIFLELILWAFFPIIAFISYNKLPSLISLTWSTLISAFFFVPIIFYKKSFHEFKNILLWKYSLGVVLFIGIIYYGLYYIGLESTTAGNASVLATFEIFTSFVFFNLLRKESFSKEYKLGAFLMILGVLIVLFPNFSHPKIGDFFIILATIFSPMGNMFQQKAKKIASTETILFLRSFLSAIFFFVLSFILKDTQTVFNIKDSLLILFINGIIVFGFSKLFWIEAISRMSVTKAISLNSAGPFVTLIFSWIILSQQPTFYQIFAMIPLMFGVFLLTDNLKFKKSK